MFTSWKIGRIAGIDLFLHPTFLLLLAWGASSGGFDYALMISAVFGCVVLHELGHALTARALRIPTRDITLYPIGGVARLERMPRSPGAELLITLAGPLVNVVIASTLGMALWAGRAIDPGSAGSYVTEFAALLMTINWVLAVFNMLPAFPMDGGRVLRALLSIPMGRYRATEVAASVGRILAVALPILTYALHMFSPMQLVLAAFIYFAAGWELVQVRADERCRRGDGGISIAPAGYRWVNRGNGCWQLAPISIHVDSSWVSRP